MPTTTEYHNNGIVKAITEFDGKLFSCCADTLEDARAKRDNWLARKNNELEG